MFVVRACRAVVAACLALAALASPALAAGPLQLSGPVDGASLPVGSPLALHARADVDDRTVVLRVSTGPGAVDACGRIAADVAFSPGLAVASDPAVFAFPIDGWNARPGTFFWQVERTAADGTCAVTAVRRLVLTGALAARPAPTAGLARALIPRRIGTSNRARYVIRTGGVPRGVSRARYLAVVRNSARRWRLRYGGRLPGRPVIGNGRSEVGFSTAQVPRQALAVTVTLPRRRAGAFIGLERDLILRADLPWQEGPAHPAPVEVDLETVVLHEFGHVAGNGGHVGRGCADTPMVIALDAGEWWRAPGDFSFADC